MGEFSYELFNDDGNKVWLRGMEIDLEAAKVITQHAADVGKILGASGKLPEAILSAVVEAENPELGIEQTMTGLIMHGAIERDTRLSRIRGTLGRITKRKPFFYARTQDQ